MLGARPPRYHDGQAGDDPRSLDRCRDARAPVDRGGAAASHVRWRRRRLDNNLYFDDHTSNNDLAAVVGVDAAVQLSSHVSFVPTLRVLMTVLGGTYTQTSLG